MPCTLSNIFTRNAENFFTTILDKSAPRKEDPDKTCSELVKSFNMDSSVHGAQIKIMMFIRHELLNNRL